MKHSATYSPEDNKLRLYPAHRLDAEDYAAVKAAGFRWAPKQELFVAPMWTPDREDLLIGMAGEIDDEDKSLAQRAEERAERFEDYSESRAKDAQSARAAVDRIADGIPFGQPILVGHHSEKHARRDAEKIRNGMRKTIAMWQQSQYWTDRAAGAVRAAKYKELPAVRARRIKGLESDLRRVQKLDREAKAYMAAWATIQEGDNEAHAKALHICNYSHIRRCFPLAEFPRNPPASQYEGEMGLWSALKEGIITWQQAKTHAVAVHERSGTYRVRWIGHYQNRLAYERAMLEEAGGMDLLKPKPRRALAPMLNYRAMGGSITTENQWDRGRDITYPQVEMTKAEYAAINQDYRGARVSRDKQHRFRTAMIRHSLVCVFLTDSKAHPQPAQGAAPPAPEPKPRPVPAVPVERKPDPMAAEIQAMQQSLKTGIQIAVAPQLFPTSKTLARQMVDLAGIEEGDAVLEPSAGTGAILDALYNEEGSRWAMGGGEGVAAAGRLVAVEVNQKLADALRRTHVAADVRCADFLDLFPADLGTFDVILMNPPFERGADIKHVTHALRFLKPGGRLVAICANGPRQRGALMDQAEHWQDLPAGSFEHAGTGVNTAMLVMRQPAGPQDMRQVDVCASEA